MKHLLQNIRIRVNEQLYLKDPESSDLGKRIIEHSILLIDELGFESFTFKKLGRKMGSNEASLYRYFENKHKLLLYLTSWYWGWLEYQFVMETNNIQDPEEKLQKAIEVLSRKIEKDSTFSHVNEVVLNKIVINENSKSFLTKEVDRENKEGYFEIYKRLVYRVRDIIQEIRPKYPYPNSLASTILEGSLHQYFLADHFSSLTDCAENVSVTQFFTELALRSLKE